MKRERNPAYRLLPFRPFTQARREKLRLGQQRRWAQWHGQQEAAAFNRHREGQRRAIATATH